MGGQTVCSMRFSLPPQQLDTKDHETNEEDVNPTSGFGWSLLPLGIRSLCFRPRGLSSQCASGETINLRGEVRWISGIRRGDAYRADRGEKRSLFTYMATQSGRPGRL